MGSWEWDIRTGRVRWSENLEAIHGRERGSFGGTLEDVIAEIHPDDRERVSVAIARAIETRGDYNIEYRIITPAAEVRWLEGLGHAEYDDAGTALRMSGICMDVTERKEDEETTRRRCRQLNTVYRVSDAVARAEQMEDIFSIALDSLIEALRADRASILLFDSDGVMRFKAWRGLSQHYRSRFEGHSPWSPTDQFPAPITMNDIKVADLGDLRQTIINEGISALAFIPLISRGRVIGKLMVYYDKPHRFLDEEVLLAQSIAGHVAFAIDRRRSEQALRESEQRFRTMCDSAPVLIWMSDVEKRGIYFNRVWLEFTGAPLEDECGAGWVSHVHPDDLCALEECQSAFEERRPFTTQFRLQRRDGEYRWMLDTGTPRFSEDGEFAGYIGSCVDISDRKRAEQRQQLLLGELSHRVKNTLTAVQAIMSHTRRHTDSVDAFYDAFDSRLRAMARAHSLLTRQEWQGADLCAILEEALGIFGRTPGHGATLDGPAVSLPPKEALALSLILHELAMNAAKHGALSVPNGWLEVKWDRSGSSVEPEVALSWVERGGPPVVQPRRRGYGSLVIERGSQFELRGEAAIEFQPEGLVCSIRFPLPSARTSVQA